jgi:cbb3-type cytochrome oxidase cytochrome c subunit
MTAHLIVFVFFTLSVSMIMVMIAVIITVVMLVFMVATMIAVVPVMMMDDTCREQWQCQQNGNEGFFHRVILFNNGIEQ